MIDHVVSAPVRWSEAFGDAGQVVLFPEEEAAVTKAVERRRREFATVRSCARSALGRLGVPPAPLVPQDSGAPQWPDGIVGSMTHCAGYRAAAVGRSSEVTAIGIDAEPNDPLPEGVLKMIARPADLDALRRLPTELDVAWDRVLFSAKESIYKAWFPLARRWLGFDDAEVVIDPAGSFEARLIGTEADVHGRPFGRCVGRWTGQAGFVATAVVMLEP